MDSNRLNIGEQVFRLDSMLNVRLMIISVDLFKNIFAFFFPLKFILNLQSISTSTLASACPIVFLERQVNFLISSFRVKLIFNCS